MSLGFSIALFHPTALVPGQNGTVGNSTLAFYYVSGTEHGIWRAVQNASGVWQRGSKVLLNGVFNGNAVDPDIIRLPDGRFRLYYFQGYFITPPPPGVAINEIYSAVSADGLNFSVEGKVFELSGITDPSVVQVANGTYLMAVAQQAQGTPRIVLAASSNGTSFQTNGAVISPGGIPELMLSDDGSVRLLYNGPGGIVSQRTTDGGLTWQPESGQRLATQVFVADPSVVRAPDRKWILFVKGFNSTGNQGPQGHRVMMAESQNSFTFTLLPGVLLDSASVPEGVYLPSIRGTERPIVGEMDTGDSFVLEQNYPNPFNPSTHIRFRLSRQSRTTLEIFSPFGNRMALLLDGEERQEGLHEIPWTPRLASGVYFYRLSILPSGTNLMPKFLVRKMLLIR